MFDARVAGPLYAQPLYWRPSGSNTGMLFTATEDNVVQAFDATTSKELWRRAVGRPVRRSSLPCGNINPLGITGTPVIDPATQAIYFDAAVERPNGPRHEVFGLSLKDGSVLPGWPVDVAETLQRAGRHFDPRIQNQRSALTLFDDAVYVAFGGEGDNRLHAFRGDTGEPIFASEPLSGLRHFQSLIATRDHLYVGADERIYAFSF